MKPEEQKLAETAIETRETKNPFNKSKTLFVLLGALIIVLLTGTYYVLSTKNSSKQTQPVPVQFLKPSPTPDATINWKTYINNSYNFTTRYPLSWEYKESVGNFYGNQTYKATVIDFNEPDNEAKKEKRIPNTLRIYIIDGPDLKNISLEKFKNIESLKPVWNDITVDKNISGKSVFHLGCLSGDCYDVLFKRNNLIFDIGIPEQSHQDKRLQIFDQILSTFKFTQ